MIYTIILYITNTKKIYRYRNKEYSNNKTLVKKLI